MQQDNNVINNNQQTMDYVSEESSSQNVADVSELLMRIEALEDDNAVLRNMLQRSNANVHTLQNTPKERLAMSHDKLQQDLNKEKHQRQTLATLLDEERRAFEQVKATQQLDIRRSQDNIARLKGEVDNLKVRIRDSESLMVSLRRDNDNLRIENDSLRFQQRKIDKKDPHAPFVHRNGPVPFSQVLRALNAGKPLLNAPNSARSGSVGGNGHATSRSTNLGMNTGRSSSSMQQQQNGNLEDAVFVDPNNNNNNALPSGRSGSTKLRSVSPVFNGASSGSRTRQQGGAALLEIREGARVTWQSHQGIIRYIGGVDDFAPGEWIGVELIDGSMGDHAGCYAGRQYFVCSRRTGIFCRQAELSAPRLLEQFPAERNNNNNGESRSASMLTTGNLRSASTNEENQQQQQITSNRSRSAGGNNTNRASSPTNRSQSALSQRSMQPASPRRVSRSEHSALKQAVDDAFAAVQTAQANIPFFAEGCSLAELNSIINLVNPTENIHKIMTVVALSLRLTVARDPQTGKDMWDRGQTRHPRNLIKKFDAVKAGCKPAMINAETAEFVSAYHCDTLDLDRVQRSGGNPAVTLGKYVIALTELANALTRWANANASFANVCCDEEEQEQQEQQQEEAAAAAAAPTAEADEHSDIEETEEVEEVEEIQETEEEQPAAAQTAAVTQENTNTTSAEGTVNTVAPEQLEATAPAPDNNNANNAAASSTEQTQQEQASSSTAAAENAENTQQQQEQAPVTTAAPQEATTTVESNNNNDTNTTTSQNETVTNDQQQQVEQVQQNESAAPVAAQA